MIDFKGVWGGGAMSAGVGLGVPESPGGLVEARLRAPASPREPISVRNSTDLGEGGRRGRGGRRRLRDGRARAPGRLGLGRPAPHRVRGGGRRSPRLFPSATPLSPSLYEKKGRSKGRRGVADECGGAGRVTATASAPIGWAGPRERPQGRVLAGRPADLGILGPVVVVADRGAGPAQEEPRRPGTQRPTRERKTTAARGLDSAVSTRRTHWDRLSSW